MPVYRTALGDFGANRTFRVLPTLSPPGWAEPQKYFEFPCNAEWGAIDCEGVTTATGTRVMTDWSNIVREYGPLVWRIAFRLLNREADAADCFQQTFLAAVEFAEKRAVRDWTALLRHLSTARAIEQLRLRYRSAGRSALLTDVEVDPSAPDPLAHAAGGELADRLRESLAAIEPRQATAFCLTALDGMSNAEAGEVMGASANHVGVLVSRARQALRKRLIGFDPKVTR